MHNFETYVIHADFCRAIANPKRLMIIDTIGKKRITVGELAKNLNLPVSNVSQHLKILKNFEVVKSEKVAHSVYYTLTDKRLLNVCENMKDIISDLFKRRKDAFNLNSS